MTPPPPLSLELEADLRLEIRRMQANIDLCLNYVREIARIHLSTQRIRELEDQYEGSL